MESKKDIRKKIFAERKLRTDEQIETMSRTITDKVTALPAFKNADRILVYADYNHEVVTEYLIKEAWKAGTINKWLADNCFGDYYTRKGLTLAERERVTFCFLSAQGGCEPQLIAHSKGNMNMGNDKEFLTKVVLQCVPYIGYPRSLNAINCINKAGE